MALKFIKGFLSKTKKLLNKNMKIELREITVSELIEKYENNQENGVVGFGEKLDIRPPYQREFVYKPAQQEAVIETILNGYPLNVMYWATREDGTFEVIDGQQRTISICNYTNSEFSYQNLYFHNLPQDKKDSILSYKLMIYICTGVDSEKLKWFETINIAGEKLTKQELRNAVYSGSWVSDAKKYFSKTGCPAYGVGEKYLNGSSIRQDYLETTIKWISEDKIEDYMSKHASDANAVALWSYFQAVISWVQATFSVYRKEMKGIEWGFLYNEHKDNVLDAKKIENEVKNLMEDVDVTNKKGIYEYILTKNLKHLSIRAFDNRMKREVFEKQNGVCVKCEDEFELSQMEADHITPWSEGGKTDGENCQMLCQGCNRRKSNK
jgi:hypothetical protein